ncbi:hypothetical protein QF042_004543 [Pedobacter sp. W3I1]|nr:hypothetical protein [Pedobacter sp. W3I1]
MIYFDNPEEAKAIFLQFQSQYSSRLPNEYNVDASGETTKISDKGEHLYDYYNYAYITANPSSGKL